MHVLTHLLTSLLVALVISFSYSVDAVGFILAAILGIALDLDHIFYYAKYHGAPRSLLQLVHNYLKDVQGSPKKTPRYHTVVHEMAGLVFFLLASMLIARYYSLTYALILFASTVSHMILDALSIRMMPFSPFSKREVYIGVLKPNTKQERNLIIMLLILVGLLALLKLSIQDLTPS